MATGDWMVASCLIAMTVSFEVLLNEVHPSTIRLADMAKLVQTSLGEDEYRLFKEILDRRKMSIREGLRKAVEKMLKDELKVDPKDPFLARRTLGKSGLGDLSRTHDEYLYGKKRRPKIGVTLEVA